MVFLSQLQLQLQLLAIAVAITIAVNWCCFTDRTGSWRGCGGCQVCWVWIVGSLGRCLRIVGFLGRCLRIRIEAAVIAGIKVGPSRAVVKSTFEPYHAIFVQITITMVYLKTKHPEHLSVLIEYLWQECTWNASHRSKTQIKKDVFFYGQFDW